MIEIRADAIPLKCACCGLPFGYLQDGLIVIVSRHNGEKHTNIVPLVNLDALRQKGSALDGLQSLSA